MPRRVKEACATASEVAEKAGEAEKEGEGNVFGANMLGSDGLRRRQNWHCRT